MGTLIRLSFIVLIIVISPLSNGDITSEEICTEELLTVAQQNRIFMIQYFEGDTVKALKYIEEVECDSLRQMVLISLSKQELYFIKFDYRFNVKFQTLVSSGLRKEWTPAEEYTVYCKANSCPSPYGGILYKWNCIQKEGMKLGSHGIHGLLNNKEYEKYLGKQKSHGCVRISNSIADYFYSLTYVGLKVVII